MGKKFKIQPKTWPKEYTFEEFKRLNPNINESVLINYYQKYLQDYAENYSRHVKHFEGQKNLLASNLTEIKNKYSDPQHFLQMYYGDGDNVTDAGAGVYTMRFGNEYQGLSKEGLTAHFDLQNSNGYVLEDTGTVSLVKDLTGNGYSFGTALASAQPEFGTDSNGYNRIRIEDQKYYFGAKGGGGGIFTAHFDFNFIRSIQDINETTDTITLTPAHDLKTGDGVRYYVHRAVNILTGDTTDRSNKYPSGLTNDHAAIQAGGLGTEYFVIKVSDTEIKLASSLANAQAGTAIDLGNPASTETGAVIFKLLDLGPAHTIFYVVKNNETIGNTTSHSTGFGDIQNSISTELFHYNWGLNASQRINYSQTGSSTSFTTHPLVGGNTLFLDNGFVGETFPNIVSNLTASKQVNNIMLQTLRMQDSASLGIDTFPFGRTISKNGLDLIGEPGSLEGTITRGITGHSPVEETLNKSVYWGFGNKSDSNTGTNNKGDFFMYELLMYNRHLSNSECAKIEHFLNLKYGKGFKVKTNRGLDYLKKYTKFKNFDDSTK